MKKFLITSALPYINGVKHLGNLVGSILPADFYARYLRMMGHDVLYVCATDEHGTPAELSALAAKQSVDVYCLEQHQVQKDTYDGFNISWDYFGRTSSRLNHKYTQDFARSLWQNGFISTQETSQIFCIDDDRFLPDRYVTGTCPHCGFIRARGDQCENCTRVLDPTDLIAPRSSLSGSNKLEIRKTRHLFLRQSLFVEKLKTWIDSKSGTWPILVTSIANKWLNEGLHDRSITRDLKWGVPVDVSTWGKNPDGDLLNQEDFDGKVFYVWFDAPIGYISTVAAYLEEKKNEGQILSIDDWLKASPDDVEYYQFMAKDNIPFHTVGFPVTLLGANDGWALPTYIKGFNWLTYEGGKFSTSERRGVFMDQALAEFNSDAYRYWLLANAPEGADSDFGWEAFSDQVNKDLADVLGNFVNRTVTFCQKHFESKVPIIDDNYRQIDFDLFSRLNILIENYSRNCEQLNIRKAVYDLRAIWVEGNSYINAAAPWTDIKNNYEGAGITINICINLVYLYSILSDPIVPSLSKTLRTCLGVNSFESNFLKLSNGGFFRNLNDARRIDTPGILFAKIPQDKVQELKAKYAGS